MATALNHDNSITVTAYSLPEFTFEIAYLGSKGFTPSMLNSHCPTGGMGSWYTCIMVARDQYRIDKEGNHVNVPNTSQETALKDDSSDVNAIGGTGVSETTNVAKTAVKRTPTKKTT